MMKLADKVVVIGVSAGGFDALPVVLQKLPFFSDAAIIIVPHRAAVLGDDFLIENLKRCCCVAVEEAKQLEYILPATVYVAPGGYHLLINNDKSFALNIDAPVCFSRPSIDVLFETAADAFHEKTVGVIMTGANSDGAEGMAHIKKCGGVTIVQSPSSAEAQQMPEAAIAVSNPDWIVDLDELSEVIVKALKTPGGY